MYQTADDVTLKSILPYLDPPPNSQDTQVWSSGGMMATQSAHFSTHMSRSAMTGIIFDKIRMRDSHQNLKTHLARPVTLERSGQAGSKVVILEHFTITVAQQTPQNATVAQRNIIELAIRHQLQCDIAAIGGEKDAVECLVSCLVYLQPNH